MGGPAMARHLGAVGGSLATLAVQASAVCADATQPWPKSNHVANAFTWLCLLCLAGLGPLSLGAFAGHCGPISLGALALFALGSAVAGAPFTREHAMVQLPEEVLQGSIGDEFEHARHAVRKATLASAAVWATALALAAILQEIGFVCFEQKSPGEILLCHLSPPLLILCAARRAGVLAD